MRRALSAVDISGELGAVQVLRGLRANRERPDLESLAAENDPERFVRRMLPHAARSFAASIVMLPREQARAASVAYLYCRMLDTYEDLLPDLEGKVRELTAFGARFEHAAPAAPAALPAAAARDERDRGHLLLVERCALVDTVYATFDDDTKALISGLVSEMAAGMVWSTETFAEQGGVLTDTAQLTRYCRIVIGLPTVFLLELVRSEDFNPDVREDALLVSELVQLANVTRDIEADLERGVGYHPALRPLLGARPEGPEATETVRRVREELTYLALTRAPAYRRMYEGLGLDRRASVRTAAIVLLLFTSMHYRDCAIATGNVGWRSPRSRSGVIARGLPWLLGARPADRVLRGVDRDLMNGAAGVRHRL